MPPEMEPGQGHPPPLIRHDIRELDYAHVRDLDTGKLRSIFIRLVKRGDIADVDSIESYSPYQSLDVTIDEVNGQVVGVNISWLQDDD